MVFYNRTPLGPISMRCLFISRMGSVSRLSHLRLDKPEPWPRQLPDDYQSHLSWMGGPLAAVTQQPPSKINKLYSKINYIETVETVGQFKKKDHIRSNSST